MKKILSLMLTVMILLTSVSLTAVAEDVLTPVSIYAGARTVTVEYNTETLIEGNVGEIELTTLDGIAVPYTTKINGEFLTIIADEEFVRDTQEYILKVGNTSKVFKIKTLFTPNFVADTTNKTVNDLFISQGDGAVVDVVDKDTVILSTVAGSIALNYDEIANYDDASLVADVYFVGPTNQTAARGTFAYNVSDKAHNYAYAGNYAPKVSRAVWYLDSLSSAYYKRMVAVTDGTELKSYTGFSNTILPIGSADVTTMQCVLGAWAYGSAYTAGQLTVGTTTLPEGFDRETRKYRHVIDKMGAVGTLMVNDTFVDIMDSQDYYDEYSLTAPTKGYFVINPLVNNSGNYRIMLSNMALITSEMRDYATGTLTASAAVNGEKVEITFEGAEDIDLSSVAVENYISISEDLEYDVISKEGNKIVIEVTNPEYGKAYTLTVGTGLGYDALTVKEDKTFNITFEDPNADALEPLSIYAGARTITVEYSETVTADNVGEIVLTTIGEAPVSYTTKFNDEFLTIIADEEFVRDSQEYILKVGNTSKVFKIKTLFTPNFVADTTNKTVNDLFISQGSGAVVDVVDKDTVILSTVAGSIALNYDEIANYEDASLVADVYFVGPTNQTAARGTFAYNVSDKAHNYAYAGNYAPKVSRAVWYLDSLSSAYYKRMVAVTDGTELKSYTGFSNTILPIGSADVTAMQCVLGAWAYGSAYTAGQLTVGTTTLPEGFDRETRKYRHVIDKMGAVGTLMVNDTFVDIMDSQDYYDEYSLTAPTKGYFVINPLVNNSGNYRIMLSNMALITSEMRDYASGTLTVESAVAEGKKVTITLAGANDMDLTDVAVENYISFSEELSYNVVSKADNKIVIEVENPVYANDYVLTVAAGLGYDALTVKEDKTFNITFEDPNADALEPVSIYAGARTVTVEYNTETLTEGNVGEIELTTLDGIAVPYTTKINDEFLTIIADEEFVRDTQEYILKVGNTSKIFKIKTLFKPEFEKTSDTAVNDLFISQGGGAVVDVVDKDTVILSTVSGSIALNYDEIANYEDASLVADVYFVGPTNQTATRGTFAYNVSNKSHDYAYAGNYAPKVSRAVWYLDSLSSAYYKRMVAVTDGTELKSYTGFSNTILPIGSADVTAMNCVLGSWAYGSAYTAGQLTVGTTTLPEGFDRETRKYRHVIDKMGAVGTLMVNDTFVDIMDSQDYYDEYSLTAPTKGYFVINPLVNNSGNYRIMLSNMALITSEMRDYEAVEITDVTFNDATDAKLDTIQNATDVKGAVTVWNRFPITKNIKLVAVAYSGNKMIDVAILDINNIAGSKKETRDYSFTNLSGLTHIKVLAWEDLGTMYPYCKAFENNK